MTEITVFAHLFTKSVTFTLLIIFMSRNIDETYFDMLEHERNHKMHLQRLRGIKPCITTVMAPVRNGRLIRKAMLRKTRIAEQRKEDAQNLKFIKSFHLRIETLRQQYWKDQDDRNPSPIHTSRGVSSPIPPLIENFTVSEPKTSRSTARKTNRAKTKRNKPDEIDRFIQQLEEQIRANEQSKSTSTSSSSQPF